MENDLNHISRCCCKTRSYAMTAMDISYMDHVFGNKQNKHKNLTAFKLKADAVISSGSTSAICLLISFEASYAVAH